MSKASPNTNPLCCGERSTWVDAGKYLQYFYCKQCKKEVAEDKSSPYFAVGPGITAHTPTWQSPRGGAGGSGGVILTPIPSPVNTTPGTMPGVQQSKFEADLGIAMKLLKSAAVGEFTLHSYDEAKFGLLTVQLGYENALFTLGVVDQFKVRVKRHHSRPIIAVGVFKIK